jgi:membrane associated rhomboid family serine protease
MGFQDRGYYRERYTPSFAPEWTAVMTIIIVNIGLWVANLVAAGEIPITAFLALKGNLFERPWDLWQLVTYGFVHDPTSPMHVFVNMLALFFFGREVEAVLGRERFVRFYLIAIVIAGLAWLAGLRIEGMRATLVGASGGVAAVIAMFIWYFPRQTVLIYGILPVPAWAFGLLYFFSDLQGAAGGGGRVAHVAHIGGALFGLLYAWQGGQLENLTRRIGAAAGGWFRRRPDVRLFRGQDDRDRTDDAEYEKLKADVDRILEKISRSGESSLTSQERKTLADASRRLKERMR